MSSNHRTCTIVLDDLPIHSTECDLELDLRDFNSTQMLTVSTPSGVGLRMATGLRLFDADSQQTTGAGQLVFTDDRLVGLVTDGTSPSNPIEAVRGVVSYFTVDRTDVVGRVQKNWRGKPVGLVFEAQDPVSTLLRLDVYAMTAALFDDGSIQRWDISDTLDYMKERGWEFRS